MDEHRDTSDALRVDRARPTLRELALEKMKQAILGSRFAPGERLVERDLCDQLGVSRSVVREVLRHLEAEGLVETLPQRGPAIARPTLEQARQIYEIRAVLEGMAAKACALSATSDDLAQLRVHLDAIRQAYDAADLYAVLLETDAFYRALFHAGHKDVAWTIVRTLNGRINQLRAMTIATSGRSKRGPAELTAMVDAIEERNPELAFEASVRHVQNAAQICEAELAGNLDQPHTPTSL